MKAARPTELERRRQSRDAARDAVERARATLAEWRERAAAERAEIRRLEESAGDRALEAEGSEGAVAIARELTDARDRADIAMKAAAAQEPRVLRAEMEFIVAVGDVVEAEELIPAREAVEGHQRKLAPLLKEVEALEGGRYVPETDALMGQAAGLGPRTWRVMTTQTLAARLRHAEQRVAVCRALGRGEDAQVLVREWQGVMVTSSCPDEEYYPAALWGQDAVVSAPAFVSKVEQLRAHLADVEAAQTAPGVDVEARARAVLVDGSATPDERHAAMGVLSTGGGAPVEPSRFDHSDEIEQLRDELDALTGGRA